jgi:hypothetical protein
MFRIAFSEYIIENKTYGFAKEQLDKGFEWTLWPILH